MADTYAPDVPRAPRELLTTAEVAAQLGVSPRRVSQLVVRRPDFPRPYAITRGVRRSTGLRLWRPEDIERWAAEADRSVGRPAERETAR